MSGFFYDIEASQRFKFGQDVCGDVFITRKLENDSKFICVLSDGLGSGIKANVLATLTASMAAEYAWNRLNVHKLATTIMSTLPIDRVRRISYSTFTIVSLDTRGRCMIVEFDNPGFQLFRGQHVQPVVKQAMNGKVGRKREYTIYLSEFSLQIGDRILLLTDGVTQSGMGSDRFPFGWESEDIAEFCGMLIGRNTGISARALSHEVVEHALANNAYHAQDDITCAVINVRSPRRLLVVTGPPFDKQSDSYLAFRIRKYDGQKVICGGTTANIVARELQREVETDLDTLDDEIPCVSRMEGVDLITEGMITMGRVLELLEQGERPDENSPRNGATMLVNMLLDSDIIDFIIGNKINEAHQDPTLPIELGIRRNVVRQIAGLLDQRYMKKVTLKFV